MYRVLSIHQALNTSPFFLLIFTNYLVCTECLTACMCTICVWYPPESEQGIRTSETGVTNNCDHCGCWESNLRLSHLSSPSPFSPLPPQVPGAPMTSPHRGVSAISLATPPTKRGPGSLQHVTHLGPLRMRGVLKAHCFILLKLCSLMTRWPSVGMQSTYRL